MSKYVKNLIVDHLRSRLSGVSDAILVDVIGLNANANNRLRTELGAKNIRLMVVKNSLASRAVADTPLAAAFDGATAGSTAICWGASDIVALAKEITKVVEGKKFEPIAPRGGVMDGTKLTAAQVAEVSKWPSREEQLSLLVGQILGPGARLAAQLKGPGGRLVSQIKSKAEGDDAPAAEAAGAEAATAS